MTCARQQFICSASGIFTVRPLCKRDDNWLTLLFHQVPSFQSFNLWFETGLETTLRRHSSLWDSYSEGCHWSHVPRLILERSKRVMSLLMSPKGTLISPCVLMRRHMADIVPFTSTPVNRYSDLWPETVFDTAFHRKCELAP